MTFAGFHGNPFTWLSPNGRQLLQKKIEVAKQGLTVILELHNSYDWRFLRTRFLFTEVFKKKEQTLLLTALSLVENFPLYSTKLTDENINMTLSTVYPYITVF